MSLEIFTAFGGELGADVTLVSTESLPEPVGPKVTRIRLMWAGYDCLFNMSRIKAENENDLRQKLLVRANEVFAADHAADPEAEVFTENEILQEIDMAVGYLFGRARHCQIENEINPPWVLSAADSVKVEVLETS